MHCTANRENEFADFIPCFGSSFSKKENCLITIFFYIHRTMSATGVSLWEVVEARGGPLRESETWAVLAASATSLQDTALSGKVPLGSEGSVGAAAAGCLRPFGFLGFCGRRRVLACLVFILDLFKVTFSNKQTKKKRPPHLQ